MAGLTIKGLGKTHVNLLSSGLLPNFAAIPPELSQGLTKLDYLSE